MASADGKVEIQIRDLDQTVVGNPAYDLIRLGLSLATAARVSDLPGVTTAVMLEHMIEGHQGSMKSEKLRKAAHSSKELRPIETVLRQSVKREWRHLAQERIEDVKPIIPPRREISGLFPRKKEMRSKDFSLPRTFVRSSSDWRAVMMTRRFSCSMRPTGLNITDPFAYLIRENRAAAVARV